MEKKSKKLGGKFSTWQEENIFKKHNWIISNKESIINYIVSLCKSGLQGEREREWARNVGCVDAKVASSSEL